MAKHKDTTEIPESVTETVSDAEASAPLEFIPVSAPDPITVSELEKLPAPEKQDFRAKGGTVISDPE
jgi:hypothetical protein